MRESINNMGIVRKNVNSHFQKLVGVTFFKNKIYRDFDYLERPSRAYFKAEIKLR